MENETAKKILRYTLTPQLMPRIQELFFSGFSYVAFFMAQTYRAARLLPAGHPYLSAANMGRYGVRHVIVEAGHNLVFKRENIDQILIYIMMLAGMALLVAQMLMLGMGMFVQTAHASGIAMPTTFLGFFLTPDATHDVALVLLDRVFGLPDFFTGVSGDPTCVVQGVQCFNLNQSTREFTPDSVIYTDYFRTAPIALNFPWPFHLALHKIFEAYSIGILLIAVFIVIYFVIAVAAETAQSGTPFGQRFNHVWAPLRIVAAIGLLVPLASGLNSGQYILMFAAKWGSGFATNGWILFHDAALAGAVADGAPTLLGGTSTLVAHPNYPPVNTLVEFGTILATCVQAYERMYHERDDRDPVDIDAWLVNTDEVGMAPVRLEDTTFEDAVLYFNQGDIIIRFGELRDEEHQTRDGAVVPFCGEIVIQATRPYDDSESISPGADFMLETYWNLMKDFIWFDASQTFAASGCDAATFEAAQPNTPADGLLKMGCIGFNAANRYLPIDNDPNAPLPNATLLDDMRLWYQDYINGFIDTAVELQQDSTEWTEQLRALGWGGAAVWYNKVAQLNGSLIGSVYALPAIKRYPLIMEKVRRKKAASDTDAPGSTRHQLYRGPDAPIVLADEEETQIGKALFLTQTIWGDHYAEQKQGGNMYIDIINTIFGTAGLFNIHDNADAGVHPLAQLASIGRTIIDTAVRNLGYSAAAGLGGGIINLFGDHMVGRVAMTASSFLTQAAMIGLTLGFVLFYIIPLLPFIYFFFAVGGWIKGIFEAMVGVPLWALAHIRIDGNGLPGDAAMGGYYLILEIFLRPILVVFGFIASITIFAAQVQVLHEIWPLIVSNVTGFDVESAKALKDQNQTGGGRFLRGAIDKLFFTVIYAIVVYMLAMSSFKMIDLIPNHVLRWMGASVSTFGDQSGDPAENLVRNSFMGSNMVSNPLKGAMGSARGAAKEGGAAMGELFGRSS